MPQSLEQEIRTLQSIIWSERDPEGRAFAPLADAYLRAGEIKKALELLTNGMSRHPAFASGHVVAARLYLQQGMHGEAKLAARRALELDGENVMALATLAEAAEGMGEAEEASRVRDALASLDPEFEPDEAAAAGAQASHTVESAAPSAPDADVGRETGGAELAGAAAPHVGADEPTAEPDTYMQPGPPGDALDAVPGLGDLELVPAGVIAEPLDEVVDVAALAPTQAAGDVVDVGALAPDQPADEVVDVTALAPAEPSDEVVDVGALAPAEPAEEVVDVGALAPAEPAEEVVDVGALAPAEAAEEVMDVGALAPDREPREPLNVAELAPDGEPAEAVAPAELAPDEPAPEAAALALDQPIEGTMEVGARAPDDVVDLAALAPDAPEPEEESMEASEPTSGEPGEEAIDVAALAPDEAVDQVVDRAPGVTLERDEAPMTVSALAPDEPFGEVEDLATLARDLTRAHDAVDIDALAPDSKPKPSGPAEPIYTRTLAELYVKQGFVEQALDVLRHLLEQNPDATDVVQRIAELEGGDLEPSPSFTAPSPAPAAEPDQPEEEETETLARDLAESGAEGHDVDTPFAWTESEGDEPSEEAGPLIGDYFDRLLEWQPKERP